MVWRPRETVGSSRAFQNFLSAIYTFPSCTFTSVHVCTIVPLGVAMVSRTPCLPWKTARCRLKSVQLLQKLFYPKVLREWAKNEHIDFWSILSIDFSDSFFPGSAHWFYTIIKRNHSNRFISATVSWSQTSACMSQKRKYRFLIDFIDRFFWFVFSTQGTVVLHHNQQKSLKSVHICES